MPKLDNVNVSRRFLEYIEDWYPAAFENGNAAYRRFLQELLFSGWVERTSGQMVLSRERLAQIEGQEHLLRQHRYYGQKFLQKFQDDTGLELQIKEAQWWKGEARTVSAKWPARLESLLSSELRVLPSERVGHLQLVDFETLRPMSKTALAELGRERRKARQRQEGPADVQLLNSVSSQAYSKFTAYFADAQESADSIVADGRRHSNLRTLYVLDQWGLAPTYQAVLNSPRYYILGVSMAQLSPKVRQALLRGAWSLDLAAAQLAILARLWELSEWQGLLESAVHDAQIDVWEPLLRSVNLQWPGDKRIFKTLVYAAAFGMSRRNLLTKAAALGEERAAALFQTSLMRELLAGRAERRARLEREGGIVDPVNDRFVTLAEREQNLSPAKRRRSLASSLMAYEAQAHELNLMRPVLERVRADARLQVVLWLHDGCYVTSRHGSAFERQQIERVVREVEDRAARLGIATRLTNKRLR